jgi:hypothetical protein
MRTQFFVEPAVTALIEKIKILVAQEGSRRQTFVLPAMLGLNGFLAHDCFTLWKSDACL